jgi:predicted nucleic acid-binding protein
VRIRQLIANYSDLLLGMVDVSVIALAERYRINTIATLDRRHFGVIRLRHVAVFTIVP